MHNFKFSAKKWMTDSETRKKMSFLWKDVTKLMKKYLP